jgi:phospho-N-acetylmuramoyl-pentapeptide-transferase
MLINLLPEAHPALRFLLAAATALPLAVVLGRPVLALLARLSVREDTEKTPIEGEAHRARIAAKSGTPTMGGLIVLGALLTTCVLWGDMTNGALLVTLGCVLALAAVGAVDDILKLRGKQRTHRGLKARYKILLQAVIGAAVVVVLIGRAPATGISLLPVLAELGPYSVGIWIVIVIGTMSNAANVTDGMDGLLAGLTALIAVALGVASSVPSTPDAAEMAVFFGAVTGASLGFLVHNRHPARVFMGDTGSLALGGGMACAALAAGSELVLLVAALVLLVELGSSLLQIGWFKCFGRTILPIAPIHHYPEKLGADEVRIVHGFYLGGACASLLALLML